MAGSRHALLVGVGRYDDERMPALSAPIKDVEEFGRLLRDRGGFEVQTSVDDGFAAVREKLIDLTAERGADDTVLLFYSGHGQRDFSGRLFLTTRRSNPKDPEREGIDASFVQDRLSRCRASRKMVILDCCYSGAFDEAGLRKDAPGGPLATLSDFESSQGAGTFVLMASEGGATVPGDPAKDGTSRFTSLLLRGLRGEAAPDDEDITAQHLASFAERVGPAELGVQPRSTTRQAYGKLVLVRNPEAGMLRLPKDVLEGLRAEPVLTRIGAAWRLGQMARDSGDAARAAAARRVLEERLHSDSGEQILIACKAIEEALKPPPDAQTAGPALAEAQAAREAADAQVADLSRALDAAKAELAEMSSALATARAREEQAKNEADAAWAAQLAAEAALAEARHASAQSQPPPAAEPEPVAPKAETFWSQKHVWVTAVLVLVFAIGNITNANDYGGPALAMVAGALVGLAIGYGTYKYRTRKRA